VWYHEQELAVKITSRWVTSHGEGGAVWKSQSEVFCSQLKQSGTPPVEVQNGSRCVDTARFCKSSQFDEDSRVDGTREDSNWEGRTRGDAKLPDPCVAEVHDGECESEVWVRDQEKCFEQD